MTELTHITKTYRQLRLIAGWTLIAAPLLIIAVAYITEPTIKAALSDYYFAEPKPGLVRTLFTGFLILVGGILIAYRGFDNNDNWIHNAAGAFAVSVAIFPEHCGSADGLYCAPGLLSSLHLPSAVLVFVFAAWAVYYCGGPNLKGQLKPKELSTLRHARMASIGAMALGVVLYVTRPLLSAYIQEFKVTTLTVELFGFFGFAAYWLVMTRVIDKANHRIREQIKLSKSGGRAIAASLESKAAATAEPGLVGPDEEGLSEIP